MYSRALAIIGGFLVLASGAGEVYRQKPRSRSLQSTGQVFLGVYLICMVRAMPCFIDYLCMEEFRKLFCFSLQQNETMIRLFILERSGHSDCQCKAEYILLTDRISYSNYHKVHFVKRERQRLHIEMLRADFGLNFNLNFGLHYFNRQKLISIYLIIILII